MYFNGNIFQDMMLSCPVGNLLWYTGNIYIYKMKANDKSLCHRLEID